MSRYSVNDLFIKYVCIFYIHIKHPAGIRNDTEGTKALHKVLLFARRDHFYVQVAIKIEGI